MSEDVLSLFPIERICFDETVTPKKAVIDKLMRLAVEPLELEEAGHKKLLRALMAREDNGSTAVGNVGIPHVKNNTVSRIVGALGVFPAGLDFRAVDREPVHMVFLLLSPKDKAEEHVQVLRQVSLMVRKPDFIRFARQVRSAEEARGLLEEMGG